MEAGITVTARSAPFHVHDYPDTGLLRKTVTDSKYTGPFAQVGKVINAYTKGIIDMECKGCPAPAPARQKTVTPPKEVELENWNPCDYPIFIGAEGSCTA